MTGDWQLVGALDDAQGRQIGVYRRGGLVKVTGPRQGADLSPHALTVLIGWLTEAQADATLAEITSD